MPLQLLTLGCFSPQPRLLLGWPVRSSWLANHLPTFGLQLEAGQVVTTGSCTGLVWVESRQRVTGEFLGFGAAAVELA